MEPLLALLGVTAAVWVDFLVTATGVLELAGAAGLLVPRLAVWAAGGLALLLIAMFPANVHAAQAGILDGWRSQLWPRTALQLVSLAAVTTVLIDRWRARPGVTTSARGRSLQA